MAKFLVVQPYLDVYGGGEKVCHNVVKTLVAHKQSVELLTLYFDAEKFKEIAGEEFPKEVIVHSAGKKNLIKPPFTIYKRHRAFVKMLKEYSNRLSYDYLFSTQSSSPFEPLFLKKAKKNIGYVHFPEIHFDYYHSSLKKKAYLWLFKKWVEQGISKLDMVFCNSNYTKQMIERYWKNFNIKDLVVVYPPVNLDRFWCDKPLSERQKRVVYTARFIPSKRHEIMKRLAADLPGYEFVGVGGLTEAEKDWFAKFSQNLPPNYILKTNLDGAHLASILHDSRVYVHLMKGEHFGIAPVEGLASGCATVVHNSGGMTEFIPEEFRWETYEDLKEKIVTLMDATQATADWEVKRQDLWSRISVLNAENFQDNIWHYVKDIIEQ